MYDIVYYELPNGEKPVKIFIDGLDVKLRVKALSRLEILSEYGRALREPYSKAMGHGIFEQRVRHASDAVRIMYFFYSGSKIIMTNGFTKKSQKTPKSELNLAMKYKADYERSQA